VQRDAAPGYILSHSLEAYGRPVAFAFAGAAPVDDGSPMELDIAQLKQSMNYQLLAGGHAYPLFYDALPVQLRETLAEAARQARALAKGLWPRDTTRSGLRMTNLDGLENTAVIFPKLFRRLAEYCVRRDPKLNRFKDWLWTTRERVLDLPTVNFMHLVDLVSVDEAQQTVSMMQYPEELVFISEQ
jgi:hypothetical protein